MRKRILDLAIPNIVSNITVPLLGLADLVLLGHLSTANHIGAIALGGAIFNFIYMGFIFLRMSTVGFAAQAHGANNPLAQAHILGRALLIALLSAIMLIISQLPIAQLGFWLLDGSADVENFAQTYFYIRIYAAPATLALYALSGWFLGMQNARIPMIIALVVNLVNVGANAFFIVALNMHSSGVALGTVIAQYTGLLVALFFLFRKYKNIIRLLSWAEILYWNEIKRYMQVNSDIFIRTILLISVLTFFTARSASYGTNLLAANTLLLQFFMLFSYFMDGFASAAEALTGKFLASKKKLAFGFMLKLIFKWGVWLSAFFTIVYALASDSILRIFTDEQNILNAATDYRWWVVVIPFVSFASFLWDGVFIGATFSKQMRNSMFIASSVFFGIVFLPIEQNNHWLWAAMVLFLLARGVVQTVQFWRHRLLK